MNISTVRRPASEPVSIPEENHSEYSSVKSSALRAQRGATQLGFVRSVTVLGHCIYGDERRGKLRNQWSGREIPCLEDHLLTGPASMDAGRPRGANFNRGLPRHSRAILCAAS